MTHKTTDFGEVLNSLLSEDKDLAREVERSRLHMQVAMEVVAAREELNLSQREAAEQAGIHPSALARMESTDYQGHSLNKLFDIAWAFGKRVEIHLVDRAEPAVTCFSQDIAPSPSWTSETTYSIEEVTQDFATSSD